MRLCFFRSSHLKTRVAAAASGASARLSVTSSVLVASLEVHGVRGQQCFERVCIDLALRKMRAKPAFELAADVLTIGHLDLGDEPIEPKPHSGIADPVA